MLHNDATLWTHELLELTCFAFSIEIFNIYANTQILVQVELGFEFHGDSRLNHEQD